MAVMTHQVICRLQLNLWLNPTSWELAIDQSADWTQKTLSAIVDLNGISQKNLKVQSLLVDD